MADSERVASAGPAHLVSVREPSAFIGAIDPSGASLARREAKHFSCTGGLGEDA